ncbi:hypothetical protein LguiB_024882 [Lonicera macranthoides]
MGSSLSVVVSRPRFSVEARVLRKPKTGKWARLPDIDMEGQIHIYEHIMFPREYLDLVPVDRQKNKYLSPEWYNIVHDPYFIDAHLRQSTTVIFIHSEYYPKIVHYVEMMEGGVKITNIRCPSPGPVWASCNGLVLYSHQLNCNVLIAYAASTRDYKEVHVCKDKRVGIHCIILTLGVDNAWRGIDVKKEHWVDIYNAISAGAFLYWHSEGNYIGLDVETEEFHKILCLKADDERGAWVPLAMGSFFISCI